MGCDGNDPLWRCARIGSGRSLTTMSTSGPAPLISLQHATLRGAPTATQHQSHFQQGYL